MKKFYKIICLLICFVFVFVGCTQNKTSDSSEVETISASIPVEVIKVTKSMIENKYKYSGKVKPINEVNVLSQLSGKVLKVNFDVGDVVKKDSILFEIDTTDIVNNINTLKAGLQQVDANIQSAKTGVELSTGGSMQLQIEQAKSSVIQAKASYDNTKLKLNDAEIAIQNSKLNLDKAEMAYNTAKNDYANNEALYNVGILAQNVFDQYDTALKQSEIAYNQAKISVEQAQSSLNQINTSLTQAQESYEQAQKAYEITANQLPNENKKRAEDALMVAQAAREQTLSQIASAEKSLSDAIVKSPITGVVSSCNVKEGTLFAQGSSVPFTIIDISNVDIEVNVSEQLINSIHKGDIVDVKVNAVSDSIFKGNITSISPAANTTSTYAVKIEINNADGNLKSGMFGEVYFIREKNDNTIVLPRSVVISNDKETYVMIEQEGIAKKINVTLGIDTGNEVEILTGLEENMNVITKGQTYLLDGDKVEIVTNPLNEDKIETSIDNEEVKKEE